MTKSRAICNPNRRSAACKKYAAEIASGMKMWAPGNTIGKRETGQSELGLYATKSAPEMVLDRE